MPPDQAAPTPAPAPRRKRRGAWDEAEDGAVAEVKRPPFYGSTDDFYRHLRARQPGLLVPEGEIVYLGESTPGWHPGREADPGDGPCLCGGVRLTEDDVICCPRCHYSGFDRKLDRQLEIAGFPPPESRYAAPERRPGPDPRPATPEPTTPKARWWRNSAWSNQPAPDPGRGRDQGRQPVDPTPESVTA